MSRPVEIAGEIYGSLTALRRVGSDCNGQSLWEFACSCGSTITRTANVVRSGGTTSCGCSRIGEHLEDLSGKRFGRLSVVRRDGIKSNPTRWLCRCDCGSIKSIAAQMLKAGNTQSCGCYRSELFTHDLRGQRFGKLVVVERHHDQTRKTKWSVRCDCGRMSVADTYGLRCGDYQSCGCTRRVPWNGCSYRSKWEVCLAMALDHLGIVSEYESHHVSVQRGGKTHTYIPDFYLPESSQWIEVKGWAGRPTMWKCLSFAQTHPTTMVTESEFPQVTGITLDIIYKAWARDGADQEQLDRGCPIRPRERRTLQAAPSGANIVDQQGTGIAWSVGGF